jgi:purine-binding chemotaxis protein CheW
MNRRENRTDASSVSTSSDRIETQYLGFPLGDERFAVEILKIREIRPLTPITPIPNAPEHIRGVVNLRGTIVPVFDLKSRFRSSSGSDSKFSIILVVTIMSRIIGIIADAVPKVLTVHADDIAAPPDFGHRVNLTFVSGVLHRGQELLLLLDLERLLADELGELNTSDPAVSAA